MNRIPAWCGATVALVFCGSLLACDRGGSPSPAPPTPENPSEQASESPTTEEVPDAGRDDATVTPDPLSAVNFLDTDCPELEVVVNGEALDPLYTYAWDRYNPAGELVAHYVMATDEDFSCSLAYDGRYSPNVYVKAFWAPSRPGASAVQVRGRIVGGVLLSLVQAGTEEQPTAICLHEPATVESDNTTYTFSGLFAATYCGIEQWEP